MRYYRYFSDIIASQADLPELEEVKGADLAPQFRFNLSEESAPVFPVTPEVHHWQTDDGITTLSLDQTADAYILDFPGSACFSIEKSSREITGYLLPGIAMETMRHLLLDQVLPRLFSHYLGYQVFHASCVRIDSCDICFIGDTGFGKSTIAAGFLSCGCEVLTDDCTRIFKKKDVFHAQASYGSLRLLPDSSQAFEVAARECSLPSGFNQKLRFHLRQTSLPFPVRAFFVLSHPRESRHLSAVSISRISGQKAVVALIKNSFSLDLRDNHFVRRHFARISELAASGMNIFALKYPREYALMPDTVAAVRQTLDQTVLSS